MYADCCSAYETSKRTSTTLLLLDHAVAQVAKISEDVVELGHLQLLAIGQQV